MSNRDRRTSAAAEDRRRTGTLVMHAMQYLNDPSGKPDGKFADVIITGCTASKGNKNYPPKGHGYPRKDR
ncbi:hypothetical protein ACFOSC_13800 [Streptantibioticus rubrisoli]|uniref:Uncharacterized protein n=1 Tax=Streptantibioticus rubrisoli TaxID=1387313 RepID=A0ABT1PFK9_9ACTN|nr:hypothetical protein [Streptantibioticus rubrisoli]MCQ4043003.1 hypothetical protein [Streptantibioticus rubrisoli]